MFISNPHDGHFRHLGCMIDESSKRMGAARFGHRTPGTPMRQAGFFLGRAPLRRVERRHRVGMKF
jgi:hypothetical protein